METNEIIKGHYFTSTPAGHHDNNEQNNQRTPSHTKTCQPSIMITNISKGHHLMLSHIVDFKCTIQEPNSSPSILK